jgi:hypothetical protein
MQIMPAMNEGNDTRPTHAGAERADVTARLSTSSVESTSSGQPTLRPARKPYTAPRVERRIPIVANTLLSGGECVLPGDPCD